MSLVDVLLLVVGAVALAVSTVGSARDRSWIPAATVLWFAASTFAAAFLLGSPPGAADGAPVDPMLMPIARWLTVIGIALAGLAWTWIEHGRELAREDRPEEDPEAGE